MNQQCALALKKQLMQRNVVMGRTTAKPSAGFEELIFTTKFGTPINTQTYSDATIHNRFAKFQESDKGKENIVYLSSIGT